MKLRLQPIQVYCFHQTSAKFDPTTMWKCDWTEIEQFKRNILKLKSEYTFISLSEAYEKLKSDSFRLKKYAVLTSDDGWASLKEILPWLNDLKIPITLFVNPCYLDGKHFQERETEKLLTGDELQTIVKEYEPWIAIASHGWVHRDVSKMPMEEFCKNVMDSERVLVNYPGKINFYAFTYGRYTQAEIEYLQKNGLIPVLVDGCPNREWELLIHRDFIDGKIL